jgi:UDPglucose--hexose-1-phosphate uridylyltransferase
MSDSQFIQNPISKQWVVYAPKRFARPDMAKGMEPVCPFCYGHETMTPLEVFRIGDGKPNEIGWKVRVVPNKFQITKIHEIIIGSPDHQKNLLDFSQEQVKLVLQAYKQRFLEHKDKGQVLIFHNHGRGGAESLPHPHSQLAVIPFEMPISAARLGDPTNIALESDKFIVFCPLTSEWPYETWIAPKRRGFQFGEIDDKEIADFSYIMPEVLRKLGTALYGMFDFNFYIYPGGDWYWRLIPRVVIRGGFELATGIMVNTLDPTETVKILQG